MWAGASFFLDFFCFFFVSSLPRPQRGQKRINSEVVIQNKVHACFLAIAACLQSSSLFNFFVPFE
jgi:hypothetical protein